jgi:hypothetical protein
MTPSPRAVNNYSSFVETTGLQRHWAAHPSRSQGAAFIDAAKTRQHRSSAMTTFEPPSFRDRVRQSSDAKARALEQLRLRPPPDQAMVAERKAAAARRQAARAEKSVAKKAAAEAAARSKAKTAAKAAAPVPSEAERKAARDARYAARKARR